MSSDFNASYASQVSRFLVHDGLGKNASNLALDHATVAPGHGSTAPKCPTAMVTRMGLTDPIVIPMIVKKKVQLGAAREEQEVMEASTMARLLLHPNLSPNSLLPPFADVHQMTSQEASVTSLQGEGIPMTIAPVVVGTEGVEARIYQSYMAGGLGANRLKIF